MAIPRRQQIIVILDDLVLIVGASLWFWLVLEALKPGLVSLYWDLNLHTGVFVVLCIISALLQSTTDGADLPSINHSPATVIGVVMALLGVLVIAVSTSSGIVTVGLLAMIIGTLTMIAVTRYGR